ncbi:MAG: glycoside hydrolase family 127 protein [Clostridia bacterium]|nr:glycoside hydrolase family 127 protein [Clostridia bacterium]
MVNNVIKELDNARVLRRDADISMKFERSLADAVRFIERNQICEVGLWQKFVNVFKAQQDGEKGRWLRWRSEFWGKMMRGASMVLAYTKDEDMYRIVESSVRDMLSAQEASGRISGFSVEKEFTSWDLWGRKYVMLGMMYFLEICRDEALEKEIVAAMCRHADYILDHVGEGKLDIRKCSNNWEGMNSCSILEPMVRLYRLTGEKKYLDFSEYIISTGFIESADLIELALEDKVSPYQYPVVKAYEMMSCFEGLLQYYCVTGIEKYKTAVLNFGRRVAEEEQSIIGCSGCTHELFDHTVLKQTQTDYEGIVQETCVTVTWMKFAAALLELSGDVTFADKIEQSFYNCYLGSLNTHRVPYCDYPKEADVPQVLPFDSYSPLVADRRGRKVGGYGLFPDGSFYGCCACIGAAGAGTIPRMAVLRREDGIAINFYEKGVISAKTPGGKDMTLSMATEYPYDGKVAVTVDMAEAERFTVALRVPAWSENATLTVDGKTENVPCGYAEISREWKSGDVIVLDMPMEVRRVLPPEGADNQDMFAGYLRGPVVLAADMRVADPTKPIPVKCDEKGYAKSEKTLCPEIIDSKACFAVELENGETVRLINYSSAGKTWRDDSKCAAWLYR